MQQSEFKIRLTRIFLKISFQPRKSQKGRKTFNVYIPVGLCERNAYFRTKKEIHFHSALESVLQIHTVRFGRMGNALSPTKYKFNSTSNINEQEKN